jgi:hypothetical protein
LASRRHAKKFKSITETNTNFAQFNGFAFSPRRTDQSMAVAQEVVVERGYLDAV